MFFPAIVTPGTVIEVTHPSEPAEVVPIGTGLNFSEQLLGKMILNRNY